MSDKILHRNPYEASQSAGVAGAGVASLFYELQVQGVVRQARIVMLLLMLERACARRCG